MWSVTSGHGDTFKQASCREINHSQPNWHSPTVFRLGGQFLAQSFYLRGPKYYVKFKGRTGAESFLRSWQSLSYSRNYVPFMEPEGSLPCSQQSITGSYHEPDESSPQLPTFPPYCPKIHFNIIFPSTNSLPGGLFPSDLPIKMLHTLLISPMRVTCSAHLILLHPNNIWWNVHVMERHFTAHPLPFHSLTYILEICAFKIDRFIVFQMSFPFINQALMKMYKI
jgi:hypothetical protein